MNTHDPKYKHKPSEKHTLEEVLKSLQDMIRNDLRDGEQTAVPAEKSRPASAPAEQIERRAPTPPVREDFAPTTPASGPVNLDAVVRSLKDLISNELDMGDPPAVEQSALSSSPQQAAEEGIQKESTPVAKEPTFEKPDLPNSGKEQARPQEPAPAAAGPALDEEIVADGLAPLEEEPVFEEPDELGIDIEKIVGQDIAATDEAESPPLAQNVAEMPAPEGLAPVTAEPVMDASTAPGIGDEPAAPVESPFIEIEQGANLFAGLNPPDEGSVEESSIFEEPIELSLDEELVSSNETPHPLAALKPPEEQSVLEEPGELNLDEELASFDETPAPPHADEAGVSEKFEPLDEELTFDEPTQIIPPPPTRPVTPEFPGEINPEMLDVPEEAAPPVVPVIEKNIAPGSQQEFSLDALPPSAAEPVILSRNLTRTTEPPRIENISSEAATDIVPPAPAEPAPAIEVEESFEEIVYRAAESPRAEALTAEKQQIQEIIAAALEPPAAPESLPPIATSDTSDDIAPTPPPAPLPGPASESITPPAEKKIKLEVVDGPLMPSPPRVAPLDFDAANLAALEASRSATETIDTRSPATATPQAVEKIHGQTDLDESETIDLEAPPEQPVPAPVKAEAQTSEGAPPRLAEEPSSAEDRPAAPIKPKKRNPPAATGATQNRSAPPASAAGPEEKPPAEDDIPVLNEVVAPPAGRGLAAGPASTPPIPPLPTPDRAHDIVVRAVAKLNVEMRKAGGTGLDTKTILRLQKLIHQELEKNRNQ